MNHNSIFPEKTAAQFTLSIPTKIYAGSGEVKRIKRLISKIGTRALIVSMQDLSRTAYRIEKSVVTKKTTVKLLLLKDGEPECRFIDKIKKELRSFKADIIVGIGGGTAIDVTKSLAIGLTHSEPIWLYTNLSNRPPLPIKHRVLPIIAVPTTSGTGTEVTHYSVLTNTDIDQKGTIQQPEIFPKAAVLDPELTKTMPSKLTASSGIDAFIQSLESFINVSKFSPVAEWASKESMSRSYAILPKVYRNLKDINLRLEMSWASTLSGIAITHRGTTAVHAIAEPLGAIVHIPHSDAVALCALPVLRRSIKKASKRFAYLCDILEPGNRFKKNTSYKAEKSIELIRKMFRRVNMLKRLKDYCDIRSRKDELLKSIVESKCRPLAQHPICFKREELKRIIEEII